MPFKKLMYFMLSLVKENSQNALERFFPKIKETVHMSQQPFSMLKNKMKFESVPEKASIYVAQDFLAQALVFNRVQDVIGEAEEQARFTLSQKRCQAPLRSPGAFAHF